jgi:hypothetical protein
MREFMKMPGLTQRLGRGTNPDNPAGWNAAFPDRPSGDALIHDPVKAVHFTPLSRHMVSQHGPRDAMVSPGARQAARPESSGDAVTPRACDRKWPRLV